MVCFLKRANSLLKAERNLAWVTDLLPVDEGFFFEEKQPADIRLSHKLEISFPVSLVPLLQKPWERDTLLVLNFAGL